MTSQLIEVLLYRLITKLISSRSISEQQTKKKKIFAEHDRKGKAEERKSEEAFFFSFSASNFLLSVRERLSIRLKPPSIDLTFWWSELFIETYTWS